MPKTAQKWCVLFTKQSIEGTEVLRPMEGCSWFRAIVAEVWKLDLDLSWHGKESLTCVSFQLLPLPWTELPKILQRCLHCCHHWIQRKRRVPAMQRRRLELVHPQPFSLRPLKFLLLPRKLWHYPQKETRSLSRWVHRPSRRGFLHKVKKEFKNKRVRFWIILKKTTGLKRCHRKSQLLLTSSCSNTYVDFLPQNKRPQIEPESKIKDFVSSEE